MRCLLISPVRALDPPNGDVAYTEQLMACPPKGVEYTDYLTAQQQGHLVAQYRLRSYIKNLGQGNVQPLRDWLPALANRGLNTARRHAMGKLLLHEEWKMMRVVGAFDVIHVHGFPIRIQP